jgi:hypothetical protein
MKSIITSLIICFSAVQTFAQIQAGDIAFLAMQSDAPDAFAFVALQDIPGNTSISFTDNGWNGSALFTNEQTVVWTAPSIGVPAGSVIIMQEDTALPQSAHNVELVIGPGTAIGELNGFATAGDQILAYTGTVDSPNFIAAISLNLFLPICNTTSSGNTNFTCLPAPLEESINAVVIAGDSTGTDNLFLDFPEYSGNASEILAFIMNTENWTYDNDPTVAGINMWPEWVFTFINPDPSEVNFQTGFFSLSEGGASQNVSLNISPESSGIQTVTIQLSGAANESDLLSNPNISANSITLTLPVQSSTISFNLSALADGLPEGTEVGTLTIISTSSGLTIGSGNVLNFEITEPEGISFASFSSVSQTVSEGDASIQFTVEITPVTASVQTFNITFSEGTGLTSSDYTTNPAAVAGSIAVSVNPGETAFTFSVNVLDDTEIESPEDLTFTIVPLSSQIQVGLNATSTLTILDNDAIPVLFDLYINEVMASNTNTIADENGEFNDWIEIYNNTSTPADLAGLSITDDITLPAKYQFPSGSASTVIAPGGFILVWADNTVSQGPLHTNFTLSPAGEFIGLYASNGDLIDSLTYEALGPDESYGYDVEVDGELIIFEAGTTTPNASNTTSSVGIDHVSKINATLYPNPANENVQLNFEGFSGETQLHIFDVSGRLLIQKNINEGVNLISINTQELPAGSYLIRLGSNQNRMYRKLIVQH